MAVLDAGVDEADSCLTRHVPESMHELHRLTHLLSLPHGVSPEVHRHCGDMSKVARVKAPLGSVGSQTTSKHILLISAGDDELIRVVVVAKGSASVDYLSCRKNIARLTLSDADLAEVAEGADVVDTDHRSALLYTPNYGMRGAWNYVREEVGILKH